MRYRDRCSGGGVGGGVLVVVVVVEGEVAGNGDPAQHTPFLGHSGVGPMSSPFLFLQIFLVRSFP